MAYTLFPIKASEQHLYRMYKQSVAVFWTPDEIDFSKDMADWNKLSSDEQAFVGQVLAFFAGSDGIVQENLATRFQREVDSQVVKLFSHELDFSRDIQPGDRFSMVFDRKVTASGRTIAAGNLLFAEIRAKGGATRLYRFKSAGMAEAQYFDEFGKNIRGLLLRTPLDSVRITSSFGMRNHPILRFTRMHAGIDFGAPQGTPVYAAGDGVVERADWAGGYGRWLQLKHANGYETGYGHLSRWAVKPGQRVHQGQVVAFVGSTGLSTGPHLHYEIIVKGKKVNPTGFKAPPGVVLAGREMAAFKAEKSRIDGLVAHQMAQNGASAPGA